jgi:hypothetical protein
MDGSGGAPGPVAQTSQIWRRFGRGLHALAAAQSGGSGARGAFRPGD